MFQVNKTKVIRKFNAEQVWYGLVTDVYRGLSGHSLVECTTPEGWKFMSDPSHLEIINAESCEQD